MQVCHSYRHLKANKLHPEAVAKAGIASVWRWGKVPNISNFFIPASSDLWETRGRGCVCRPWVYTYTLTQNQPLLPFIPETCLWVSIAGTHLKTHTHIHNKKYMTTSFPSTQAVITVTPWGSVQRGFQSRIRRVIFCLCVYVRVCVSACVCV